jgi:hypothetical protein
LCAYSAFVRRGLAAQRSANSITVCDGGPEVLLEAGCPQAGQAALAITGRGGPGAGAATLIAVSAAALLAVFQTQARRW